MPGFEDLEGAAGGADFTAFAFFFSVFGSGFTLAFAFGAALVALCPAFTAGLLAFFADFGACFGALFDGRLGFDFAFVLPAIVYRLKYFDSATYNCCPS